MKKYLPILVGIGLVLGAAIIAIVLLHSRRTLSMTAAEYKRWPYGAMVRLVNHTHTTVRYLAEQNGLPMGSPVYCVQKAPGGWPAPSKILESIKPISVTRISGSRSFPPASLGAVSVLMATASNSTEMFVLRSPKAMQPGDRLTSLLVRELKPGQSVEFFIGLEPDAAPLRVGTICLLPQGKLEQKLRPWLNRVRKWCRMKPTVPGMVEVWCPDSLCVSASGEPIRGR
jgi:hypothetical protein